MHPCIFFRLDFFFGNNASLFEIICLDDFLYSSYIGNLKFFHLKRLILAMCFFAANEPFICHGFLTLPFLPRMAGLLRLRIPTERGNDLRRLRGLPNRPLSSFGKNTTTTANSISTLINTLALIQFQAV